MINMSRQPIATRIETRAYFGPGGVGMRLKRVDAELATWDPNYSVAISGDGPGEDTTVRADQTTSRTQYQRGEGSYTVTNVNGDHGAPFRGDYSIDLADDASGEFFLGASETVMPMALQSYAVRRRTPPLRSQALRCTVSSTQGRIRLRQISLTAQPTDRSFNHI